MPLSMSTRNGRRPPSALLIRITFFVSGPYQLGRHFISTDCGSFVWTLRASTRTWVWPRYMATSTLRSARGRRKDFERSTVNDASGSTSGSVTYSTSVLLVETSGSTRVVWLSLIGRYVRVTGLSVIMADRLATKMSKRSRHSSWPAELTIFLLSGSFPSLNSLAIPMPTVKGARQFMNTEGS